ncbi:hypothetical protein [Desulfopila aestuarii]|uniref:Nucleoside recognition protein n=1 Tax=Desulfopila aestuarii DSM 18488 TaxID=1121416 RepID=A0A1M7YDG0_9BACT|nr:hypothetical protein [Desulfopila aestuarii]SHO50619.1 hypothetical protein SAMN02745220_03548 [Desulfopila aestuarii DSM 18488]
MDFSPEFAFMLWERLIWPLIRLIVFISLGLLVANFIEALNWTRWIGLLSRPLARLGNMSDTTSASFSLAIFSGLAANTLLAEAFDKEKMSRKELIIANLFNSFPTYFTHLPTIFFITVPLIHAAAFIYVGMTVAAAVLRTLAIVLVGRFVLPKPEESTEMKEESSNKNGIDWHGAMTKSWKRFKRRIRKIITFTVPIYIVIFIMHRVGYFRELEQFASQYLVMIPWLSPQSIGIITLHLAAELTAGVAAAGALLQEGAMSQREIILALLVGNVLSSPLRAVRHQFPYYAGIFKPAMAAQLIIYSQASRVISLVIVGVIYYYWTL